MSTVREQTSGTGPGQASDVDAVIIGAGFSGCTCCTSLRNQMGLSARVVRGR